MVKFHSKAYRDIPDVKDDWYDDLEENKYREVLNIQSQIEAINNEIAYLQVNMLPFLTIDFQKKKLNGRIQSLIRSN